MTMLVNILIGLAMCFLAAYLLAFLSFKIDGCLFPMKFAKEEFWSNFWWVFIAGLLYIIYLIFFK